jgi:hypothetical protein
MLVLTFLFILAILCQNSFAEQVNSAYLIMLFFAHYFLLIKEKITRLSIYHQKNGNFIRRGEIVGLPGVPQYVSADNEITEFNDPKEIFYQIKVKDENTGNIHLSSVKLVSFVLVVLHPYKNIKIHFANSVKW